MKKMMIIAMMAMTLVTGCGKEEKATENPYIKEIRVNPIQVNPIEVETIEVEEILVENIETETITWENVEIESWD